MRPKLEVKLTEIDELFLEMGALTEAMLINAMKALETQNVGLAERTIEKDKRVDELEMILEEKCLHTIALQNPLATDLRRISAVMKMITDMERIGDYSEDIAEVVVSLGGNELFKPLEDLPKMGRIVQEMLHSALDAFVRRDVKLAEITARRDDEVDELYMIIYKELLSKIHEDKTYMDQIIALLFIGRYLERIADHVTNLCERVIYSVNGQRVQY